LQDQPAARGFYAQRQWDFGEVEYLYLERFAARSPGAFPETLGPGYSSRGEAFLLEWSRRQEEAGHPDAALASAATLLALSPHNTHALDRLACLHYQRGDLDQAAAVLADWHAVEPASHWPLVRRAVVERQRGNAAGCAEAIDCALGLTHGRTRAAVAFLGGRLALSAEPTARTVGQQAVQDGQGPDGGEQPPLALPVAVLAFAVSRSAADLGRARQLFEECLRDEPGHMDALWCLAAVRLMLGDQAGLAAQAEVMARPDVSQPRFHYLAAVCHLAAGDYVRTIEAAGRAAADPFLAMESAYLAGWAHLHLKEVASAAAAFQQVLAQAPHGPSAGHARAMLGRICFAGGAYDDAIRWWSGLDAERQAEWHFDETLRRTIFLAGLLAFRAGQYAEAVDQFRQAVSLGVACADLLTLARLRAAQRLLYPVGSGQWAAGSQKAGASSGPGRASPLDPSSSPPTAHCPLPTADCEDAARLLEDALLDGSQDGNVTYLLALARKRLGHWLEARSALRRIPRPDAGVYHQMGLISLREKQPAQAEQEFALAWQSDPAGYAAGYNLLLTQLSLGQMAAATALIPQLVERAPAPEERRWLGLLQALLHTSQPQNGDSHLDPALLAVADEDEHRLVRLVGGLGHLDTADRLLRTLAAARPDSAAVREAALEAVVVKAKALFDRCHWLDARRLLGPRAGEKVARPTQVAHLNLLGCCACLSQDFQAGLQYFSAALRLSGQDARLHQNLALAYEHHNLPAQAATHWNRYLDLLDGRLPAPAGRPDYAERLAYEGLSRLATRATDREDWAGALAYFQRAYQLRPDDVDLLERMFHIYQQTKRPDDARRTLRRIQRLRPDEPHFELYELDLVEVKNADDIDRILAELERILKKHPADVRVEERATALIGNLTTAMTRLSQTLTDQLERTRSRLRRLPDYQIDWPEVEDFARGLRSRFHRLRRTADRGMGLAVNDSQRRGLRELIQRLDRQVEICRGLGR
jgi:tetratricopeptide (TPR) repeat protein